MTAEELRAQINEATGIVGEVLDAMGPPPLMPGAESTSARLARVEAERDGLRKERTELLSILARIGDALSPTGERPEEALGTLAADVEEFVANLRCGWCGGVGVAPEELFGRDSDGAPMVDGPQPCPEGCEVADWLVAERNDARDTERERDEWKSTADQIAADITAADERLAEVAAERDTLREVAQGNKRHVAQLIALYEAVEREREELARQAAECEDLRATVAMYRQQLRAARHDAEHCAAERDRALDQLGRIADRVMDDGYSRVVDDALVQAELTTAWAELAQLRAEVASRADELLAVQAENRKLHARLERAQAQCALPNPPENRG